MSTEHLGELIQLKFAGAVGVKGVEELVKVLLRHAGS
jgi:hypothetical protein